MCGSPRLGVAIRTCLVHPGHFCRLSSDEGAARLLTALRDALHHVCGDGDVELAAAVVIEEVQRLCALHDEIIDGHGHQIDACRKNKPDKQTECVCC